VGYWTGGHLMPVLNDAFKKLIDYVGADKLLLDVSGTIFDDLYNLVGGPELVRDLAGKLGYDFPSEADVEKLQQLYNAALDDVADLTAPERAQIRSLVGKNPAGSSYWNEVKHNAEINYRNDKAASDFDAEVSRRNNAVKEAEKKLNEAQEKRKGLTDPAKTLLKVGE